MERKGDQMGSRRGGSIGRARRRANEAMRKIDRALDRDDLSPQERSALRRHQRLLEKFGSARRGRP